MMDGEYGIKDVVLSMPSIVGAEGFISKVLLGVELIRLFQKRELRPGGS